MDLIVIMMWSVFPQVLPPFLGAEWSVLQCDCLRWPGAHAQVRILGVQLSCRICFLKINKLISEVLLLLFKWACCAVEPPNAQILASKQDGSLITVHLPKQCFLLIT